MNDYTWQQQVLPIYHFEQLASTNQTAWELFQQGKTPPFLVTADEQTAGKGQWGRQWVSSRGGLYLSLLLTPHWAIEQPSHLTISSVFGVTEILASYQIPIEIKWLNDLFLQRKKLGGILTETRVKNRDLKAVVIGIGVNWSNVVPEMGIALKDYLEASQIETYFHPSPALKLGSHQFYFPPKLIDFHHLKYIVITGLLWGYQRYSQEGLIHILPQYEARLIQSSPTN